MLDIYVSRKKKVEGRLSLVYPTTFPSKFSHDHNNKKAPSITITPSSLTDIVLISFLLRTEHKRYTILEYQLF